MRGTTKGIEELTARIRILETYYPQWVLCQKTPELEQALEMDMTFDFDKLVVEQLPGITACNLNGVKKLELTR